MSRARTKADESFSTRATREMLFTDWGALDRQRLMISHWADAVLIEIRLGLAEQAGYDARIMGRLALAYLKLREETTNGSTAH